MVKQPIKPLITKKTPLNYTSDTPMEYNSPLKPKREINQDYYQKHKEKLKLQRREKYHQEKKQAELSIKQIQSKYYEAESIKILMSLKEYTELNPQKHKLWVDFCWTLKDCQEAFKKGFGNVVAIMKLEQVAHELASDYWTTARNETKKGKSWNSLDQDQKDRLIRYWGYEKARIENNYLDTAGQLEKQNKEYLKEIELAKFHEERGKKGCKCWQCEQKAVIQKEIKGKMDKELKELEKQDNEKGECCVCGKVRELEEETGACKKCSENYES